MRCLKYSCLWIVFLWALFFFIRYFLYYFCSVEKSLSWVLLQYVLSITQKQHSHFFPNVKLFCEELWWTELCNMSYNKDKHSVKGDRKEGN